METVVITGLTGKSGKWMLQRMVKENSTLNKYKFRVAVRQSSDIKAFNNIPLKIELVTGDLKDEKYLEKLCEGADTLFHIAGIDKSLLLVEVAIAKGISRLVLVHTTGIYSKYKEAGFLYRQIEQKIATMIKDKDISLTILRPTMIYGNLNDGNISVFIKMVDKLSIFPVVDHAKYALQPVWAKDLGEAYYSVLTSPLITKNKNYILAGGEQILLIDLLKVIETYLGKKNIYVSVPFSLAYAGAWCIYGLTFGKYDFREKVKRLVEPRVFSYQEAKNDFNYNPVDFTQGVKEEVEEYISNNKSCL